jgi:hypothetical protein
MTDELLALTGEVPSTNAAIISLPTPEEHKLLNEGYRCIRAIAIGESKAPKIFIVSSL